MKTIRDITDCSVWESIWSPLRDSVRHSVQKSVWNSVYQSLWYSAWECVCLPVRDSVGGSVCNFVLRKSKELTNEKN